MTFYCRENARVGLRVPAIINSLQVPKNALRLVVMIVG